MVSAFPDAVDVNIDILVQGKADTFQRELTSALLTRDVYDVLMQKRPTMADVVAENPDASPEDAQMFLDNLLQDDRKKLATVADLLGSTVKSTSLKQHENGAAQ